MIEILVSGLPDMALTHRNGGSQVLDRWLSSARNIQQESELYDKLTFQVNWTSAFIVKKYILVLEFK